MALESYTLNITTVAGFEEFKACLAGGASPPPSSRVDLVLSCVDNYEARMTINQAGWEGRGAGGGVDVCLGRCERSQGASCPGGCHWRR